MELTRLILHPEEMDKETLYDLRSLLALHPYYQTVRLLLLKNLYILHDQSFDEELRRAAVYITDRKVLFQLVEASHYRIQKISSDQSSTDKNPNGKSTEGDRTTTLIDHFLDSIPEEAKDEDKKKGPRKPTPADAAVDYVSYLLENENEEEQQAKDSSPQMKGQNLIDHFLDDGGFNLLPVEQGEDYQPEYVPDFEDDSKDEKDSSTEDHKGEEGYFTETLAKIYIKQGHYEKALEIIRRLNLNYPKKSAYFVDQIRFLEKLIINNKNKR